MAKNLLFGVDPAFLYIGAPLGSKNGLWFRDFGSGAQGKLDTACEHGNFIDRKFIVEFAVALCRTRRLCWPKRVRFLCGDGAVPPNGEPVPRRDPAFAWAIPVASSAIESLCVEWIA